MPKVTNPSPKQPSIIVLFIIIGLVPVITGFWILTSSVRETHRELLGNRLGQMADYAQLAVRANLAETVQTVDALTVTPNIIDLVTRENEHLLTPQEILAAHVDWPSLDIQTSDFLQGIFFNPTSAFLRNYREMDPVFQEIVVADRRGRTVAATNKTTDYDQTVSRWWQHAFRGGTGGSYVGDIVYDESAAIYSVDVAQPIMSGDSAIGVLEVSLDILEVFSLVNSLQLGQSGHAYLLRNDGTILVSPLSTIADRKSYPYHSEVQAGLSRERSFVQAGKGGDTVLIGLPSFSFKNSFPTLDWTLITEEPYDEALVPMYNFGWRFIYLVLFTGLAVVGSALVYSRLLSRPIIETDAHLDEL